MSQKIKTVMVFGSTGMLGSELYKEGQTRTLQIIGVSRQGHEEQADLLDEKSVSNLIFKYNPDVIINSAALISHSYCEENPNLAYAINAKAVETIAKAADFSGSKLIQISTDNYYSGDGSRLHSEDEPVKILSEYAKTKYAGENYALMCKNSIVIRTNITGFRPNGGITSFIEWIVQSLKSGDQVNLFNDYYASTIATRQAAKIIFDITTSQYVGRLNLGCREVVSKKVFVETFAKKVSLPLENTVGVSVHDVLKARSESIGLDVTRIENLLGYKMPNLSQVVNVLADDYKNHSPHTSIKINSNMSTFA